MKSSLLTRLILVFGIAIHSVAAQSTLDVHLVTDEADAVLSILAKRKAGAPITESDWQKLFSTEGYVRLKARENSMKRSFEDAEFKTFVLSDELAARTPSLRDTLNRWRRADITSVARRAHAYLPKGARIRAKVYPVIKARDNSFVFDLESSPAIFLYLDPQQSKEKFENTLAHELHHIGYAATCPSPRTSAEMENSPSDVRVVMKWIGAFGEGFAMLAAAGGPDIHPHAVSDPDERARWDKDMISFNDDLKKLEKFFFDILDKRLTEEQINQTAFSFYGTQGPWYTVGWKMSALIEKTFGRARLIECICDQRKLLPTYNQAAKIHNRKAKPPLALWSDALIMSISQRRHEAH